MPKQKEAEIQLRCFVGDCVALSYSKIDTLGTGGTWAMVRKEEKGWRGMCRGCQSKDYVREIIKEAVKDLPIVDYLPYD